MRPAGAGAVMNVRREPPSSLDYFPTPPWATRALAEIVLPRWGLWLEHERVWEPACGEGHMVEVLREYAREVIASDVHDYGVGAMVGSFVGKGPDVILSQPADWIITNPPFNLAEEFFARAIVEARGVAFLVRTTWLESKERFESIFSRKPPNVVAIFSERVPMVKGRWNPKASSATSYAWVVWRRGSFAQGTQLYWIPPGQRRRLTLPSDIERFAKEAA